MKEPKMGMLVETILNKRDPGKDKPSESTDESEPEEEGSDRKAVAQDLIDAVQSGDADGVLDAFDALYEMWGGSPMESKESCGCE